MKKNVLTATVLTAVALGTGAAPAFAGVNLDVHLGSPAPLLVVHEPPPPPREHHRFYIERRPRFLYSPPLGFYVSVDGPYDIVYYGERYYIFDDGRWYWGPSYDGPWAFIEDHRLPGRIRRFHHEDIRRYRDDEYRRYREDGRHDRGRWH